MAELRNKGQQICSGYELVVYTFVKTPKCVSGSYFRTRCFRICNKTCHSLSTVPCDPVSVAPVVYFCLLHDFHAVEMFRLYLHQYN